MNLEVFLTSLYPDTACHDLKVLLKNAKGGASWLGKKIIVVKGYEGYVDCSIFIEKFVEPPLKNDSFKKDLRNRVEALELIDLVKDVIIQAEAALKNTYVVKRLFSDATDLNDRLSCLDKEMREFTKQHFQSLFPHVACEETFKRSCSIGDIEISVVTRKDLLEITSLV